MTWTAFAILAMFFKWNLNGFWVGSQIYDLKSRVSFTVWTIQLVKLGFNFPPLRLLVKNFWRSEMAETARSAAVPALPVVRPGKQKDFRCWYLRICFELFPWFSPFALHIARLYRIFSRVSFRLSREHSTTSLELCISWLNLRSAVMVYSSQYLLQF